MSTETLTFAEAAALVRYEPETGKFYWLQRPRSMFKTARDFNSWNAKSAGTEAFKSRNMMGYCRGIINGKSYRAHRVAWLLHFGTWPTFSIDHINGVKSDNRISNLRDVTHDENQRNRCAPKCNSSGVMGVSRDKETGRWQSYISCDGERFNLGRFNDFDEAVSARKAAERRYGFHENHGRMNEEAA